MTVPVVRGRRALDRIEPAALARNTPAAELLMSLEGARVDAGDDDPGTVVSELPHPSDVHRIDRPALEGCGERRRGVPKGSGGGPALRRPIGPDDRDLVGGRQGRQAFRGPFDDHAIDDGDGTCVGDRSCGDQPIEERTQAGLLPCGQGLVGGDDLSARVRLACLGVPERFGERARIDLLGEVDERDEPARGIGRAKLLAEASFEARLGVGAGLRAAGVQK